MSVAAKICGLSTEAAVTAAVAGGAAFLGFVFYPPSPRAVTTERAARLCAAVPEGIARVGLFVDADDATISAVLAEARIDILQFHGVESPERVAEARARFGRPIMTPPMDAVGRVDRRAVARGGASFRCCRGRRLLWCRELSRRKGSRQDLC